MATKVLVCPECESAVVPGRFSCSSCGALLAAVASVSRSFGRPERSPEPMSEPAPDEPLDEDAPLAATVDPDAERGDSDDAEPAWGEPDPTPAVAVVLPPAPVADVGADVSDAPPIDVPVAAMTAASAVAAPAPAWPESPTWPTQQPAPAQPSWPESPIWPIQPTQPSQPPQAAAVLVAAPEAPAWPAQPTAPTAPPQAGWPAQPTWPGGEIPVAPQPPERTPAGAYLPPSAVLPSGESLPVNGDAGAAPAKRRKSISEVFALGEGDGPLGLPANAPGRTVAFGAAVAGFGFLLPWAEIVIGSGSMGSFFDQWGLAGPGNLLVFLLLFAVGALAVAHERFPITVSTGLPALVLGSILLGLVFPYVMGPFHEAIGVYVVAVGGVIMIVGGLLSRAASRHATADASV
ncbi:MAG TPA: hypothetical protein VFV72_00120 [Candidatus Limnocylindrales bacterium]|nr:hypothetical protein [Candidatus Limnocylindrales bacterium]